MKAKEKHDELLAEISEKQQAESPNDRDADSLVRIQRRAYELWEERDGGIGSELDDWLQAEAEVNAAIEPSK